MGNSLMVQWLGLCAFTAEDWSLTPGGSDSKEICPQCRIPGFNPWVGKIPLEEGMAGYSSWGRKELDMTERLSTQGDHPCKPHSTAKKNFLIKRMRSKVTRPRSS